MKIDPKKLRSKTAVPGAMRTSILEYLNANPGDRAGCCKALMVTQKEIGKVLAWKRRVAQVPEVKAIAAKNAELREELAHKSWKAAIRSQEDPKELLAGFIEWCRDNGHTSVDKDGNARYDLMGDYVALLRGQGISAPRMLEGLGEMGPEKQEGSERPALFNLPPGTQVDMRIVRKELNVSS